MNKSIVMSIAVCISVICNMAVFASWRPGVNNHKTPFVILQID